MKSGRAPTERPFIFLNVAMTADGKIAPTNRHYVPFGSARDHEHLLELRATADAVMAGARTVDSFPVNMGPGAVKYRRRRIKNGLAEYNLRVIVSGSGSIDPDAEIFRHRFSPIIILTSGRASAARLRRLRAVADAVEVFGQGELDWQAATRWLGRKWGVNRLLCEGGGELNAALFKEGLVDEINLTICPTVFGGRAAPTLADGAGFKELARASRWRIVSMKTVRDEVFLIYRKPIDSNMSARHAKTPARFRDVKSHP